MEQQTLNFYPAHGLDSFTGYGRMELGIAKGLQAAQVNMFLYPAHQFPMLMVNSSLQLLFAPHVNNSRLWAFNMIESNKVDPKWVKGINSQCERLLVPCPPMIKIYEQSGVTVPLDFVPLGVDLFGFSGEGLSKIQPMMKQNDPFTFLTYSYGGQRKGADLAVKAFERAFEDMPEFRLVIKVREGYENTWLTEIDNPQIELVVGRQSEQDWMELQRQAHCFVFASRGEGWGMPPRELTLAGVPTIATQWLGMWDADQWGIPVKVASMETCTFDDYQANAIDAEWSLPDVNHLQQQMCWVVENYSQALEIVANGCAYLLEHFGWQRVGNDLKELLQQYV